MRRMSRGRRCSARVLLRRVSAMRRRTRILSATVLAGGAGDDDVSVGCNLADTLLDLLICVLRINRRGPTCGNEGQEEVIPLPRFPSVRRHLAHQQHRHIFSAVCNDTSSYPAFQTNHIVLLGLGPHNPRITPSDPTLGAHRAINLPFQLQREAGIS